MNVETDGQEAGTGAEAIAEAPTQVDNAAAPQNPEDTAGQQTGADEPGQADEAGEPTKRKPWWEKRFDELTRQKYDAQRRADFLEGQLSAIQGNSRTTAPQPQSGLGDPPTIEQFDFDESAYRTAMASYVQRAVQEGIAQQREQDQLQQRSMTVLEKVEAGRAKYEDFDEVLDRIPMTPAVQQALIEADNTVEASYWLGKNPQEAHRIANLPPIRQTLEIGAISARLAAAASAPNKAQPKPVPPAPPQTVAGLSAGLSKSPDDMSMAEYIEWRKTHGD